MPSSLSARIAEDHRGNRTKNSFFWIALTFEIPVQSAAERAKYVGVLGGENARDCRRRYGESVLEVCRYLDRPKRDSIPAVRAVPVQEMTICNNVAFLESYRSFPRQTILDAHRG